MLIQGLPRPAALIEMSLLRRAFNMGALPALVTGVRLTATVTNARRMTMRIVAAEPLRRIFFEENTIDLLVMIRLAALILSPVHKGDSINLTLLEGSSIRVRFPEFVKQGPQLGASTGKQ
jgi:hypothetical protein